MIDFETQKKLLRETVQINNALEMIIYMQVGVTNQQRIKQTTTKQAKH